jgi:two-component system response regulator FixJ
MAKTVKIHIFFLDDEPTVCEVVKETVEDSKYRVSCFNDPIECLAQLRSQKCDLLIADLRMPEKDGIEVLKDVQHLAPWVPVVITTGFGDIPTAVKAMKAGAIDFIEKPFNKKNLIRVIKSVFNEKPLIHSNLGRLLTRTEKKVLQLVMNGMSNKEIANLLSRSTRTIEVHRTHIMDKLGVDNIIDLVKCVTSMGLVDMEENADIKEDEDDVPPIVGD